jgi:hypothetical protein
MTFRSVVMSDTPAPLGRGCEVADGCDYAPLHHTGHLSSVIVKVSDQILAIPNKRKGSTTFAQLLELRQALHDRGHTLVLCGVSPATKGVFIVSRLDGLFDFVADRFAALATLQMIG